MLFQDAAWHSSPADVSERKPSVEKEALRGRLAPTQLYQEPRWYLRSLQNLSQTLPLLPGSFAKT